MSGSEKKENADVASRRWTLLPRRRVIVAVGISLITAGAVWLSLQQLLGPSDVRGIPPPGGDVMYVPTPQDVVDRMLKLAEVSKDDLVYDLGCGDGRVLVTAAKDYGCRCRGYDIDPYWADQAFQNAKRNGVERLIEVHEKDIFTLDLQDADVIFLYLLPKLNVRLIPQLEQCKPGTRIVSHLFDMDGVQPDKVLYMDSVDDGFEHDIYLWTTPLQHSKRQGRSQKRATARLQ